MQKLTCFFLMVSLLACSQDPGANIHLRISNTRTSQHMNIPGTRLFIVPPPNFSVATSFIGLQKNDKAVINVYDLVGGDFYTNAATFNKAEFEKKGIKVFEYKDFSVNGYPAKYIRVRGDASTEGYELVFGDSTFSTMVMAFYAPGDAATGRQIVAALNTMVYDKNQKVDPFATANFSLDDRDGKFKFFQYSASLYVYTVDGKDNSNDSEAPFLIVTQFPRDNTMTEKSIAGMMISKIEQSGLTDAEVKDTSAATINGYPAYEVMVSGKMKGENAVLYECVVSGGDKAIVIQGVAKNELEDNVRGFMQLAHTVQVK